VCQRVKKTGGFQGKTRGWKTRSELHFRILAKGGKKRYGPGRASQHAGPNMKRGRAEKKNQRGLLGEVKKGGPIHCGGTSGK